MSTEYFIVATSNVITSSKQIYIKNALDSIGTVLSCVAQLTKLNKLQLYPAEWMNTDTVLKIICSYKIYTGILLSTIPQNIKKSILLCTVIT